MTRVLRCAIYTRKSSEEGLDQAFNSLDAQREACEAYIKSQAHEGWKQVRTAYDDGGFSGGSMERPAVQRLMADVGKGLVDVIVVYKVDRLTRSLADFAKIVETLDRQGASFVSVTQQFNTTTSMGRLTLNVLLSFAQFEREVAGERIRDKIAASKRRGMWMGGNLPLGYDVRDRQLVVNDAEADTVRLIFRRYLDLGCVRALMADLSQRGVVSKAWVSSRGSRRGGQPYSRGALYYLLRNEIYIGRIPHRGMSHPGLHVPIIGQELWDQVQATLAGNGSSVSRRPVSAEPSLLAGLLYDDRGNRMSPTWARKADGRQYRYYVSQALLQGRHDQAGAIRRLSAPVIESLIERQLSERLPGDKRSGWGRLSQDDRRAALRRLVERIVVSAKMIELSLSAAAMAALATGGNGQDEPTDGAIQIATTMAPRGRAQILMPSDGVQQARPDRAMLKAIARAHDLRTRLDAGGEVSLQGLATQEGCTRPYISSLVRLAYLAPDITQAILDGRQPPHLTLGDLLERDIPLDWAEQRRAFGFV